MTRRSRSWFRGRRGLPIPSATASRSCSPMKRASLAPMNDDPPEELRLKERGRTLEIRYATGESFSLTSELLRVESPSAEVKGHGPGQEITVAGKRNVQILK